MAEIIAILNQKGGVAKTTTALNLGAGLSRRGRRVLLIDSDPQGSLTAACGRKDTEILPCSLATVMQAVIRNDEITPENGLLQTAEGMHLLPANIELAGLEMILVNALSRETVLLTYIELVRDLYDYIIIDCGPSLGMLTINALVCADSVLVPMHACFLSLKGLEQLVATIVNVRKRLNPKLTIDGLLLTMVPGKNRYRYTRELIGNIQKMSADALIPLYTASIRSSIRAEEAVHSGMSLYRYLPDCGVASDYENFIDEFLQKHEGEFTASDIL